MTTSPETFLRISLDNWRRLAETKAFLHNLEKDRAKLVETAEQLSMSPECDLANLRALMITAHTYRKIIDYARTIESIQSAGN